LKIDVEGGELEVLFGFETLLQDGRIRVVQFEYGPMTFGSGHTLHEICAFLQQYGYVIGKLYPNYVEFASPTFPAAEDFRYSNYVAVSSSDPGMVAALGRA